MSDVGPDENDEVGREYWHSYCREKAYNIGRAAVGRVVKSRGGTDVVKIDRPSVDVELRHADLAGVGRVLPEDASWS